MSHNFLQILSCLIRCIFILGVVYNKSEVRENLKKIMIFIFLYVMVGNALGRNTYKQYLMWYIYTYLLFYVLVRVIKNSKKAEFWKLCILLGIYEAILLLSNAASILVIIIAPTEILKTEIGSVVLTLIFKILISLWIFRILKKHNYDFKEYSTKKYIIYSISLLMICLKIPFLYTDIRDAFEWKIIVLTIICCTVIFFVISKKESLYAKEEKVRMEEDNKRLSTKLHKSREILPAMVQVLNRMAESSGLEMEPQEVRKLLKEVNNLYGQQLKENEQEDLQLKSFCSTGLKILDQQLNIYQREAINKNINFDIYVQAPINDIIERDNIDQIRLQRVIGDLVRNAFHATERKHKRCHEKGHILLIIGCRYENILEIAVVDNGEEFPLQVIESFGKRGVTTGGTGNGLADLAEFAKEFKASVSLSEFDGETNSFTKKLSIMFDKQGINEFNSSGRGFVTGPFWSTI